MTETPHIDKFRRDCFVSLEYFARAYFKYTKQDYRETTYHDIIYKTIQKCILQKADKQNLNLSLMPRVGKSTIMRLAIAWNILVANGSANFLIISYSGALANHHATTVRDMLNTDFFKILCDGTLRLSPNEKSKDLFSIQRRINENEWTTTGTIRSASLRSPITGFAAGKAEGNLGGWIAIDDLNMPNATNNEFAEVIEIFNNTIRSRRNSKTTPIINVQQRISVRDLTAWTQANEPEIWDTLSLPIMNKEGKLLDPDLYNMEFVETLKKADNSTYMAQYMQDPIVEDFEQPFDMTKYKTYANTDDLDLSGYTICMTGDFAVTDKSTADYSVLYVVAQRGQECIILDYFMQKCNLISLIDNIGVMIQKWHPTYFIMEKGVIGNAIKPLLTAKTVELGKWVNVHEYPRRSDKLSVAAPLIGAWNRGYVTFPSHIDPKLVEQFESFPNGRHDDAVDALVGPFVIDSIYSATSSIVTNDKEWANAKLSGVNVF